MNSLELGATRRAVSHDILHFCVRVLDSIARLGRAISRHLGRSLQQWEGRGRGNKGSISIHSSSGKSAIAISASLQ